jgi:hypothetical protein
MIIKSFKLFESHQDIHDLCKQYKINNYSINSDGSIDVDGDVNLNDLKLSKFPIKFGRVSGNFYCYSNQLSSLEGAPSHVGGDFDCYNNQLESLEGAPNHVGGDFFCGGNPIYEIYSLFYNKKCIEPINEYDVIQGKNIVLSRLEEVYHELGMEIPSKFDFKYYKLID